MVGRRWWLLLWSWFMLLLCALCGTWCRSGEEYYSSRAGHCLPCTRCHEPEMVVSVPCYLYQDAVCTPATQFLPKKKSSISDTIFGPKSSFETKSTFTDKLSQSSSSHHKLNFTKSQSDENNQDIKKKQSDTRKTDDSSESLEESTSFIQINDLNTEIELKNKIEKTSLPSSKNSARGKQKSKKQYHKHRHRHHGNLHAFHYLENVYRGGHSSLLNNSVSDSNIKSHEGDLMLVTEEIAGATRNNDNSDKVDVKQQEIVIKPKTFILYAIVIIGLCGVLLIIIIFIHTRRFLLKQREKCLSTSEHEEPQESLGSDGSEQLLHPDSQSSSVTSSNKKCQKVITYRVVQTKCKPRTFVRPSVIAQQQQQTSSRELSSATEANATVADHRSVLPVTEQTITYPSVIAEIDWPSGQAATMDRLLEERRRIYGQLFPMETNNFYVQQLKQVDKISFNRNLGVSQPCLPHPSTPLLGTCVSHIRGSVSASASPIASRTHRVT